MLTHAAGIAMTAFIVATAISIGYYQFLYIPEANAKPILPHKVLYPQDSIDIRIVKDAAIESNPQHYMPREVSGAYGLSNKVIWTNNDKVPHTVTSDNNYVDRINGPFNTVEQQQSVQGGYIMPGKSFAFTFTKIGEYSYHCIPHPFMTGKVTIHESFV